ncbi:MAG: type IV secretion system protein [Streptosporangiaceae bacterium]|jgi:hypothetical protein
MLRPRFPCRIALVLAALAILLGVPLAARPAARQDAVRQPVAAVTLAARSPAAAGGICSVPGIGDIGSLFGLCQAGQSGLTGDLNNICKPSLPSPELADSGIDSLVKPVAAPGPQNGTLYDNYGTSGDFWAATNLQCSDMTSLIGNNVASMVFDVAKSIDRVIISVYQSAASQGILSWLTSVVDKLITSLGNAIYFPYLAIVVIIGAIWLAWQGLIRKRGTRTIEGTIWMVVACAAAIWLIGRPADFTGIGTSVSDGITQTLNVAFSRLPSPGQSSCLPVQRNDPQVRPVTYNYASGNGVVDQNANELWTVLVCKPWLDGEFGTTNFTTSQGGRQTPVNTYARQLLWAQAVAINEKPTPALIQAKQATYAGIASTIQQNDPGIYPLFQGKQWTTRLEIAFAALFAAAVAGILVLLIAVTLILLKLSFLLLLVVGPLFLLIGTHPGFGRIVALRWFEMLVGVLLKQAAVALVLSVLLYAYSLIMGTSDAVLPWGFKILMIALVTVAVFIYRRPFQHLFSAVGYGMIGSSERAEISLSRAGTAARGNTLAAAAVAVPTFAAYRAARSARRNPAQAASLTAVGAAGSASADGAVDTDLVDSRLTEEGSGVAGTASPDGTRARGRGGTTVRARSLAASGDDGTGRTAPPLNLRSRQAAAPGGAPGAANGGADRAVVAGSAGRPAAMTGAAQPPAAVPRPALSPSAQQSPGQSSPGPRPPAAAHSNGHQPRNAGPASPWPGVSGRQSLGGTQSARPAAPPSAVPPVRPAGPPPAAPPVRSAASQPVRPVAPPVRPAAAPAAGPARPAGPPPAAPPVRSAASQPVRPVAPPVRPAAAPAAGPVRPAGPPPAGPAAPAAARPGRAASPWSAGTSSARQPAAAPAARQGGRASQHPGPGAAGRHATSGPSDQRATSGRAGQQAASGQDPYSEAPAAPLAGRPREDQPESPRPFWLRPLRRRK